jgi:hypothetical protein
MRSASAAEDPARIYNIFRAFQWEAIAGVIDSQSLKSAEKGDARKMKQTQWVMTPARR